MHAALRNTPQGCLGGIPRAGVYFATEKPGHVAFRVCCPSRQGARIVTRSGDRLRGAAEGDVPCPLSIGSGVDRRGTSNSVGFLPQTSSNALRGVLRQWKLKLFASWSVQPGTCWPRSVPEQGHATAGRTGATHLFGCMFDSGLAPLTEAAPRSTRSTMISRCGLPIGAGMAVRNAPWRCLTPA